MAHLNGLSQPEFVSIIGPVFENSPWIAESTWPKGPFADMADLHRALCAIVNQASEDKQLELILAHPDLAGKAALARTLSSESTHEQRSAGLDQLTPEEMASFQKNNQAYWNKFRFPFIICARLNKREAILRSFPIRLGHSRDEEIKTALEEIGKIAYLRLSDTVEN